MSNYQLDLEKRNEDLQEELTKLHTEHLEFQKKFSLEFFCMIHVYTRVNNQYVKMEVVHHLFDTPLDAVKRLKKDWKRFRRDFQDRYEIEGFEFKYFLIEGYTHWMPHIKLALAVPYSATFETLKEVDETLKKLRAKK